MKKKAKRLKKKAKRSFSEIKKTVLRAKDRKWVSEKFKYEDYYVGSEYLGECIIDYEKGGNQ